MSLSVPVSKFSQPRIKFVDEGGKLCNLSAQRATLSFVSFSMYICALICAHLALCACECVCVPVFLIYLFLAFLL